MSASPRTQTTSFECVQEMDREFLELFSHRWDYLYAEHPEPEARPNWNTETRYPLSDRMMQQGKYLYGVRFGQQTNYLMLDLDPTSQYHPKHDPFAVTKLLEALELIGLVTYVCVQSSYRGGIHLYFPFEEPQPSWAIALVVQTLLERAGFRSRAGQLEIFPNARAFIEGTPTLYNGHRLPIQSGGYILDKDWSPTYSTQATFVANWKFAQHKNALDLPMIERVRKQQQGKQFRTSGKAQKFLNDLNAEIEPGWTGAGQTNQILGKIACREVVFHHVLQGGEALTGDALVDAIVSTARLLPGYQEFCGHQHDLEERAREYSRSAEKRYYPFGSKNGLRQKEKAHHVFELTWNQWQSQDARDRIDKAIAEMQCQGAFPTQATARFKALKQRRFGSDTLYAHKDLWHPKEAKPLQGKEFPPTDTSLAPSELLESLQGKEFPPVSTNKFVGLAGSDAPQEHSEASPTFDVMHFGGSGGFSTSTNVSEVATVSSPVGPKIITDVLDRIRAITPAVKLTNKDINPPDETYFLKLAEQELFRRSDIYLLGLLPYLCLLYRCGIPP